MMSYRCSIWPPQKQIATELDALQRKMISIACPVTRGPGEDSEQHAMRKGRLASQLAKGAGLWSKHWFGRALTWDEHVQRSRSVCKWNQSLCAFHDIGWLRELRSAYAAINPARSNPWTVLAGRTGTRAGPGRVQPRWQEAIQKARDGTM